MNMRFSLRLALFLICVSALSQVGFALQFEINSYASYAHTSIWRPDVALRSSGIYGLRGGYFLSRNFQLEGNFGVMNHFEFKNTATETRGILWDGNAAYHFYPRGVRHLVPYMTFGLGGITSTSPSSAVTVPYSTERWDGNKTFLAMNYGGGLKATRLRGPFGLRADLRFRTLPNFFGRQKTWIEPTAGINFSWGEQ